MSSALKRIDPFRRQADINHAAYCVVVRRNALFFDSDGSKSHLSAQNLMSRCCRDLR